MGDQVKQKLEHRLKYLADKQLFLLGGKWFESIWSGLCWIYDYFLTFRNSIKDYFIEDLGMNERRFFQRDEFVYQFVLILGNYDAKQYLVKLLNLLFTKSVKNLNEKLLIFFQENYHPSEKLKNLKILNSINCFNLIYVFERLQIISFC